MRVILANRYFHPDESATSRMVSSLAFGLAERGFEVEILTGRYAHDNPTDALPSCETMHGVTVRRLATTHFGRSRLTGRAADYASFHASAGLWCLLHVRRGDVVIACTDPPLLSVSLAVAIAARGGLLVNWLHDLFPEVAIELGLIPRGSLLARLALVMRDASLRRAIRNVVPTRAMAQGLRQRGIAGQDIILLPYWSEESEIQPIDPADNALRREWGLGDRFVVGYCGNFGRAHEFTTLLDAADALRDDPGIRFLLVGGGFGRRLVEDEIKRRGLTNIILQPLQPRARLAESLSAADVHIVSLLPALEPYVVPSKLYGIMAAGRPALFIGSAEGEVATTLQRHGFGETIAIGEGGALAERIVSIQRDAAGRATMNRNARAAFEAEHLRSRAITDWVKLLEAMGEAADRSASPHRVHSAASGDTTSD